MFLRRIKLNFTLLRHKHTIFALSSGHGKCGVAVIRISGPDSSTALKLMTNMPDVPKPRYASLRNIRHPESGEILDKGLVLWFPGPKSFTGEDSLELQVHGSIAVVSAILNALNGISNLRLAKPGEFTKRAFQNGKLDLTEVEGLADLLQAETEVQRKQAFLQSQGFLRKKYTDWSGVLMRNVAHIEAHIDFGETDAVEEGILKKVAEDVQFLQKELEEHLDEGFKGERLRNGVKTVIIGRPNVGKSSLLNTLCRRPAAIVSPIEGTTRDVLQLTLDIGGYPLVLTDTAGLQIETKDIIEQEGIKRAKESYDHCDLFLFVIDILKYIEWLNKNKEKCFQEFIDEELNILSLSETKKPYIVVLNKIDLLTNELCIAQSNYPVCLLSCKDLRGFENLTVKITEQLKILCGEPSEEHPSMTQARHREHLSDCSEKLEEFINNVHNTDVVLLAEYLRSALRHLGKLTGTVTTEQLLDIIFKDFCIGK